MMQERLRQIDRDLIKLLGERIAVLAESDFPFLGGQLSDLTSLLAEFGVPELVGKSLVSDCAAGDAISSPAPAKVKPRRVTVIGGNGMMGRFFTQRLSGLQQDTMSIFSNTMTGSGQKLY